MIGPLLAVVGALLLLPLAHGQASCVTSVRLVNEFTSSVTLTWEGSFVDSQPFHGAGDYAAPSSCAGNVTLVGLDGSSVSGVVPASLGPAVTIFTYQAGLLLALSVFSDATATIADSSQAMEMCQLRFINGRSVPQIANGISGECYNCSHPALGEPIAPGAASPYYMVYCPVPYSPQGSAADGSYNDSSFVVFPLVEHGSYTVVLQSLTPDPASGTVPNPAMSFLTDVDGPYPYYPLVFTPLVILALLVANCALGRFVGRSGSCDGCVKAPSASKASADGGGVTLLSFFGLDKSITRGIAARKESAEAAASDDASGGSINAAPFSIDSNASASKAPLLGGEDAEAGATAAAAAPRAPALLTSLFLVNKPRSAARIRAIDTLRGLALVHMVFVNYGGGGYFILDHAKWNGLHLADILFPTFMWTMGVSMAISFDARFKRGASRATVATEVLIRSAKLYALGCFVNGGTDIAQYRLIGVLQYFAMAYLAVGLLQVLTRAEAKPAPAAAADAAAQSSAASSSVAPPPNNATLPDIVLARPLDAAASPSGSGSDGGACGTFYRDILAQGWQWVFMVGLAIVYFSVQSALPLPPGCPTGYIGAGGLADQGLYMGLNCTGGAHRVVDLAIFSPFHVYHYTDSSNIVRSSATCADPGGYDCDIYDPEGTLGWISAAWLCFLGLQAGRVFVNYRAQLAAATTSDAKRSAVLSHVLRWLAWGVCLGLLGGGLCGFSKEVGLIPINKNLWSPSFVCIIAGLDFCVLAALFIIVDIAKVWSGAPFVYPGMNSIVTYVGSEIFSDRIPFSFTGDLGIQNHAQAMISNVVGVAIWIVIGRILYLKKIFINL